MSTSSAGWLDPPFRRGVAAAVLHGWQVTNRHSIQSISPLKAELLDTTADWVTCHPCKTGCCYARLNGGSNQPAEEVLNCGLH